MTVQGQLEERITRMVEGIIAEDPSLFVVGVKLKSASGYQRLIVLLDGDAGVTIDACSMVSRRLSALMDEQDLISGQYHLEVSSSGVDHPLQSLRQYRRNVGRELKVTLADEKVLSGLLKEVSETEILLEIKEKKLTSEHRINLKDIKKSLVLVSFK